MRAHRGVLATVAAISLQMNEAVVDGATANRLADRCPRSVASRSASTGAPLVAPP